MSISSVFTNGFQLSETVFKKDKCVNEVKAKNWQVGGYPLSDGALFITLGTFNLIYIYFDVLMKPNLLH